MTNKQILEDLKKYLHDQLDRAFKAAEELEILTEKNIQDLLGPNEIGIELTVRDLTNNKNDVAEHVLHCEVSYDKFDSNDNPANSYAIWYNEWFDLHHRLMNLPEGTRETRQIKHIFPDHIEQEEECTHVLIHKTSHPE